MLAHTMADKRADNAKPLAFHICLNGVADVGDPVSLTCKFDALVEALFCYHNELLCLCRNLSAGKGSGAVTGKTAPLCAHIDRYDVALLENPVSRDPMDDHLVDRDADACGEPSIAEEGWFCALRHDIIVYRLIDLSGCNARPYHFACQSTRCRGNSTGLAHNLYLALIFDWNHT